MKLEDLVQESITLLENDHDDANKEEYEYRQRSLEGIVNQIITKLYDSAGYDFQNDAIKE